jgi:cysteine desulfurase/selenocysteine lyase
MMAAETRDTTAIATQEIEPGPGRPAAPEPYDVEHIRADFPILYREVYGKPLVYLDNAASAQKPRSVIEAMDHVYRFEYANVHRGLHYLSNAATSKYEDARELTRRFLNAGSADEIIFTRNATAAINLVADSFGSLKIGEGDEIVLSIMEHHSNIVPWHFHRERNGAVLKWAPIADTGELLFEEFERLLTPRTKLVAITQMSNVLGTLVPVKEIIRLAHDRGIPVLVDGSQAAVHMTVDVRDLDCDFYVFTGHKTYGPSGIGVLYAKKAHLDAMPPYQGGGNMIESVHVDGIVYGKTPQKFEAGTPPIVEAIGLGAGLNYMMQVGRDRIARHEAELRTYAHARLAELPWLKVYGTAPGKGAIVSFTVDGLHPHDIATIIDRSGVAVRAGHHCAQPLMERLGLTAVCRASFAMYNTKQEVDALVEALKRAHELFA